MSPNPCFVCIWHIDISGSGLTINKPLQALALINYLSSFSFKTCFVLTFSSLMYGYKSAQLPKEHHTRRCHHTQWVSAWYKFGKTIILSVAATFSIYMTKWKKAPKVSHLYVQGGGLQMNNNNLPSTMHRALWPGPQCSALIPTYLFPKLPIHQPLQPAPLPGNLHPVKSGEALSTSSMLLNQFKQQSTHCLLPYPLGSSLIIWLHFQGILHGNWFASMWWV